MYLVSMTVVSSKTAFLLHALDVTTGAEKFGGPVTIRASSPGTGVGSSGGKIAFSNTEEFQRPALLLLNGSVYLTFAVQKNESVNPYHGWVLGYNATTLKQNYVLNTTADGSDGGIWMSGRGPAADTKGFTVMTGNGDVTSTDVGQSFVRIASNKIAGLFTDPNWSTLNINDYDLGAGGPLLIPGANALTGGGKAGTLYLVQITSSGALQMTQSFAATAGCSSSADSSCLQIHHLAYWNRTGASTPPLLYLWAANDTLKAFSFSAGLLSTTPVYQNPALAGFPGGGALAVSANGSTAGSGIVWAAVSTASASVSIVPGELRAFNASNVATELWNSNMNSADNLGNLAKFVVPVVTNGKVYMATASNQLVVYGLK